MNDDTFNLSIRKFLKMVGVSSQHSCYVHEIKGYFSFYGLLRHADS